ncbi:MAG TPA: hypothetical protein VK582_06690 [Pyrinomonadaceae bacterium]|nr:hypothetical protein [Pyrinomonadaceae bacterium]
MREFVQKQDQTQKDNSIGSARSEKVTPKPDMDTNTILQLQRTIGNQAVLRMLQSEEQYPDLEGDLDADKGEESLPHQCDDDAALDAEYDEWIHYDPDKDAEETALVNRINKEIFEPINQERNKIAADSFENTEAKKKAFPTGRLEPDASPERQKLFDTFSYTWLHSATAEERDRQRSIGVTQPVGDLSATGKIVGHAFGTTSPVGTIWDYRGDEARAAGSELDTTIASSGIEGKDNVSGYAEFKDLKGQRVFVPQLGFGLKPSVDTRQVMCQAVPVVKSGRAKRLGGPTGQNVTGSSVGDILHGGKHFFGKGTSPTTTGNGEVLGQRSGPGKPVYWYFNQLPDDPDKRDEIDEAMRKKADAIMDAKRKNYEKLKQFYQKRAAFIAKYQSDLK